MAVGDGGDGLGRAWVVEVILQVIVKAGVKEVDCLKGHIFCRLT